MFFESQVSNLSRKILECSDLASIFKPFGKITRIIIFDRKETTKGFVEFESIESAQSAVQFIHGCSVDGFGFAKVQASNKENLNLEN